MNTNSDAVGVSSETPSPSPDDDEDEIPPPDMSAAPERIYLQHDPDDMGEPFPKDHSGDEVTWCQDRIGKSDIEYIRADLCRAIDTAMAKEKP